MLHSTKISNVYLLVAQYMKYRYRIQIMQWRSKQAYVDNKLRETYATNDFTGIGVNLGEGMGQVPQ